MYQLYCYKGNYISICDQSVQMQMSHVKDMLLWLPKGYSLKNLIYLDGIILMWKIKLCFLAFL